MLKSFLIISGYLSLSIGIVGIFLPLLPTTPFLLLSSALFLRSSKRHHDWLVNHTVFGSFIKHYMESRSVTLRSKILSLSVLWFVIGISVISNADILWVKILLPVIASAVTVHIVHLRTLTEET